MREPASARHSSGKLKLAVAIATVGRPETLDVALRHLARQTRQPDRTVVCAPSLPDLGNLAKHSNVESLVGRRGLTSQRNDLLKHLDDQDIIVFFDDDFFACQNYLAVAEKAFLEHPDLVLMSGSVIADGIVGPGIDPSFAGDIIQRNEADSSDGSAVARHPITDLYNAYGCNMALRVSCVRDNAVTFDENLPLYGWLEDVDFSRRLAQSGRIAQVPEAQGVHLGIKNGRQSGHRLGYSQIANPVYLVKKGSFAMSRAMWLITRNVAMNSLRAFYPEPFVDRRGRLFGNALAVKDLAVGALNPSRILLL